MRTGLIQRGARVGLMEALLAADARWRKYCGRAATALPHYAPNGGSILNFARTPFAIDRLIALGAPIDVKDRWGSTPIESISRRAPGSAARATPERAWRVSRSAGIRQTGGSETLASMIETDPGVAVPMR